MRRLHRYTTGLTIASVFLLALLLSALPLPDWLRPLPGLRRSPYLAIREAVLPASFESSLSSAGGGFDSTVDDDDELLTSMQQLPRPGAQNVEAPTVQAALEGLPPAARAKADELELRGAQVQAAHVEIEQTCQERGSDVRCKRRPLQAFAEALNELKAGRRKSSVRVLHFGDSLIASDLITDQIRESLQARWGSGGKGFLFVDRPTRGAGRTVRTGRATPGWGIAKITDQRPAELTGISGVLFSTKAQDVQTTEYDLTEPTAVADLWYLSRPGGGDIEVRADGRPLEVISTSQPARTPRFERVELPRGAKKLSLSTRGGPVDVFGVSLQAPSPGVIYDSLGLPGATSEVLLKKDQAVFRAQLQRADPSLLVVMVGGNEAHEYAKGKTNLPEIRDHFEHLVDRLQEGAPGASCLMIGTFDSGTKSMGGGISPRPGTREVSRIIREVALGKGCAFWDALTAMGGEGITKKWLAAGMMNADLVHPKKRGGDVLGYLFDVALERARQELQSAEPGFEPQLTPRGTEASPGLEDEIGNALERTFAKLHKLEERREGRLTIVQLGASHTAAQLFTDMARRLLAQRVGDAGRGYVAAGGPSKRLASSGIERQISGQWEFHDAMSATAGRRLWGLTGVRAEGAPGATMAFTFCSDCEDTKVGTRLQLHYLEAPGSGRLKVSLDGRVVQSVDARLARYRKVRVLTFHAKGAKHTLEARNDGPGTLTILGASQDLERPGVVYDALGLPGATVFKVASYDQDAFAHQLVSRRPDLYVLFFGTNETGISRLDEEAMKQAYKTVFGTLRRAAPDAECIFIGPTDRMRQSSSGEWVGAPRESDVTASLRRIAFGHRCAFWSARTAMGGPGSIARWVAKGLAHPDHVHLTPLGYELLAKTFIEDLMAAYGMPALTRAE